MSIIITVIIMPLACSAAHEAAGVEVQRADDVGLRLSIIERSVREQHQVVAVIRADVIRARSEVRIDRIPSRIRIGLIRIDAVSRPGDVVNFSAVRQRARDAGKSTTFLYLAVIIIIIIILFIERHIQISLFVALYIKRYKRKIIKNCNNY